MDRWLPLIPKRVTVTTSVFILIALLIGCSGNQLNSTTSSPTVQEPNTTTTSTSMNIEGKIIEVMESWPLQLSVETEAGQYQVALLEETSIRQSGFPSDANQLVPGLQVQIKGEASTTQENAMIANAIELK